MPCSGADKYLDSISSIKGDDRPQTLTNFQKLVSSQVSSENWRIVYQSYQCPVFETDWKKLRKTGKKIYRLFYNWLQTHEIYLKGSNRFRWHPMFQKLIISRGVLMQPNLMCYTLQLSLGPDHIRRHPYISEDVPKFLMISRRVCMEPYLLRYKLQLSLRPPRRILTQTHLLYFTRYLSFG